MLPSYSTVSAGRPPDPPNTHLHGGNSNSHHYTVSTALYHVPSSSYGTSMARKYPHSKLRHPEHQETSRRHNASSGCAATSQRVINACFTNEDRLGSKLYQQVPINLRDSQAPLCSTNLIRKLRGLQIPSLRKSKPLGSPPCSLRSSKAETTRGSHSMYQLSSLQHRG
jgi:hypothetical protein